MPAKRFTLVIVACIGSAVRRHALLFLIVATMPAAAKEVATPPAGVAPRPAATLSDNTTYRARMLDWDAAGTRGEAIQVAAPLPMMRLTSSYGTRSDPMRGDMRFHAGVDLVGVTGEPVGASADGTVTIAGAGRGYGNMVEIDHGAGISTRYAHLSRILVAPGDKVARGDVIGLVGSTGRSTGSHLHYEVRLGGLATDPLTFLGSTIMSQGQVEPVAVTARWPGWSSDVRQHLPTSRIN